LIPIVEQKIEKKNLATLFFINILKKRIEHHPEYREIMKENNNVRNRTPKKLESCDNHCYLYLKPKLLEK
jgi:hypothetical protein